MSHGYSTRSQKSTRMCQESLYKLEQNIIKSADSFKDEIINLKDMVFKNFYDEKLLKSAKNFKVELSLLSQIIIIWRSMADGIILYLKLQMMIRKAL